MEKEKRELKIKVEVCEAYCEGSVATLNGQEIDLDDFGYFKDNNPRRKPDGFGCGDRCFLTYKTAEPGVLEKYGITEEEYALIRKKLHKELHIGRCDMCC